MLFGRPKELVLPDSVQELLQRLYPTLKLEEVVLFEGLPWFTAFSKWISGITLPHTYRPNTTVIHLRKFDTESLRGISLIVHEYYHALQYQDAYKKVPGLGYINWFLAIYLAEFTRYGYRNHPLEIPAYDFEASFEEAALEVLTAQDDGSWKLAAHADYALPVCTHSGFTNTSKWYILCPALLLTTFIGLLKPVAGVLQLLMAYPASRWGSR